MATIASTPTIPSSPFNQTLNIASDQQSGLTHKTCKRCGRTLPISEFEPHNKSRDGYRHVCKECSPSKRSKKQNNMAPPQNDNVRPTPYTPQPGNKAILTLADFTDENLFAELRRRGYSGELRYTQICRV